jgi:hypothetical protein
LPAQADVNGINRFKVRNCTAAEVMVCAYDKTDNILAIPYHARKVAPGETEKFSCGYANRCKVLTGTTDSDFNRVFAKSSNTVQVVTGGVAFYSAVGGGMAGVETGSGF